MLKFEFTEPKLSKDKANKKWYIRYGIKYEGQDKFTDRKEYGKLYKEFLDIPNNQDLNKIIDRKKRESYFNDVIYLLKKDLINGIDNKQPASAIKHIQQQVENNQKYSFDSCLDFFLKEKGYITPIPKKEQSAQTLMMFLKNQFRPYLVKNNLLDDVRLIKKSHLQDFTDFFYHNDDPNLKWSNNTFNNKRSYLGTFFSLLVDRELIVVNPVLLLKRKPKQKTQRFGVFTRDELNLLFDYMDKNCYGVSTISKVVYFSFIRISETTRSKVDDYLIDKKRIRVDAENAKGQNDQLDRYVGMRKPLQDVLTEYLSRYEHEPKWYMFGEDKQPSPNKIGKGWQIHFADAVKALRIAHPKMFNRPGLSPYAMKHSGVTHYIENHMNKYSIMELLTFVQQQCRHEDLRETMIYYRQLGFQLDVITPFLDS